MNDWIIIGSVAAYHWFSDTRIPKDVDIITVNSFQKTNSIQDIKQHHAVSSIISASSDKVFADPDILFTIKVSHANWDIKWEKTMFDISFLKEKGCKLNLELLFKLTEVWKNIHGKKSVNLMQSVSDFFNDYVQREQNHEKMHELTAFNGYPMHEKIRPDLNIVMCSEDKFNALSSEEQFETALEEIIVTSIERSKINIKSKNSEKIQAINKGYKLLCTSMCTGWFARFLIMNRIELLYHRKYKLLNKLNYVLLEIK